MVNTKILSRMDKPFVPRNESGVIVYFAMHSLQAGWIPKFVGTRFPDAIYEREGKLWRIEFEYRATNFQAHGHDPEHCDLIVCWFNDWELAPVPVLELSSDTWQTQIIPGPKEWNSKPASGTKFTGMKAKSRGISKRLDRMIERDRHRDEIMSEEAERLARLEAERPMSKAIPRLMMKPTSHHKGNSYVQKENSYVRKENSYVKKERRKPDFGRKKAIAAFFHEHSEAGYRDASEALNIPSLHTISSEVRWLEKNGIVTTFVKNGRFAVVTTDKYEEFMSGSLTD